MGYIKFDKAHVVNLEYSLTREILRNNRAGSYSSTTIVGCNTRKYHGWLVCPVDAMGGERHVLLSSVDSTVVSNGQSFNTGIHKYQGDHYSPKGHKYVEDFDIQDIPGMTFRVGNVILKQERILVHYEEQLLIRYTIIDTDEPIKFQLRPFLAFRSIHQLTRANMWANTRTEPVPHGVKIRMYDGFPYLHMQLSCKAEFVPVPDWYYGVEYVEEQKRGYDYSEDLFVPGFFEMTASKGDVIVFSVSTREEKYAGLKAKFNRTIATKIPRSNFGNCLRNAAQQFIEKRGNDTNIIAGYHWFGSWGRDTFIALPGLALARESEDLYAAVLDTQVRRMKGGLFPNMGDNDNPAFNSVDAPLWFFQALWNYGLDLKETWQRYGSAMKDVLNAYRAGTSFGIHMRGNGLIYSGAPGKALTWMDAVVEGVPVTPREGYAVEINALWYNAVCYSLDCARGARDRAFVKEWEKLPELISSSFIETFWDDEQGYLADYVKDGEKRNMQVRPNMIIATSLPYSMLTLDQMKSILDIANRVLVTPRGLRSLSPSDEEYKGIYSGDQATRDRAYHQGTVWPWLLGPFCDGWLRVYGEGGVSRVRKLIMGFEETLTEAGISTISEIFDGDPPHSPRGAISQAWSVGEILRIFTLLEKNYPDNNK
ncbi:MAG TPA: amylo-alpha-1,6-glucosidase [Bacteroidales bacterium]|jgi:predicted glycogen debranching enzyme|nr:amylo-alpha-1,6-glucosidase [Bacteroidales bacterium]HNY58111.1 amylo-alpha-1,6-glucosidase [Bacteroidales bacterium]HOC05046.1 amylo-alpha-1,6-glucosidase [Bacteroidales bacterium]HOH14224.1 amylo-alpha-1,6-glucosidase [Bacteroidales bacterium]HPH73714.1 amylo-alpha-1,6-glucosidase [Bacteroidales bacterium]